MTKITYENRSCSNHIRITQQGKHSSSQLVESVGFPGGLVDYQGRGRGHAGLCELLPAGFWLRFLTRPGRIFLRCVPVGVLSAHRVRASGAFRWATVAQRTVSIAVSEVASNFGPYARGERAVCRRSEWFVDGSTRLERPRGRYWVLHSVDLDVNVYRVRLASGHAEAICRSPALDVAQLSAALLGRGHTPARRIGNRDRNSFPVVQSRGLMGKLAVAVVCVRTGPIQTRQVQADAIISKAVASRVTIRSEIKLLVTRDGNERAKLSRWDVDIHEPDSAIDAGDVKSAAVRMFDLWAKRHQ